jgi:hypothetical protein
VPFDRVAGMSTLDFYARPIFEAWYADAHDVYEDLFQRLPCGNYVYAGPNEAWKHWLACLAAMATCVTCGKRTPPGSIHTCTPTPEVILYYVKANDDDGTNLDLLVEAYNPDDAETMWQTHFEREVKPTKAHPVTLTNQPGVISWETILGDDDV